MAQEPENRVIAFAVSPSFEADGTCFAASQRGLLKSTDHGRTWSSCFAGTTGLEQVPATAVAVSPAFVQDQTVLAAIPGGIGRSNDAGATWQFVGLPSPAPAVTSLILSPEFDTNRLAFAGSMQDGVFRSDDGGQSWIAWNAGLFDMSVLALAISPDFARDQTLFAGTGTGVFRSTNRGRAWHPVDISPDLPAVLDLAVSATHTAGLQLLAGTETHGLWISSDSGSTWREVDRRVTGDTIHLVACTQAGSGHDRIVILGDDVLACSDDGGETWKYVEDIPVGVEEITGLIVTADGSSLCLGTVDGQMHRISVSAINDDGPGA